MHQYLNHKNYITLAHRGGSLETHENTLEGFNYAVKIGCNYIETDVQASKDEIPYIFHDDDLKRVAGIDKKFNDLNSYEIDKIRIFGDCKIPRLIDCLNAFSEIKFNIDLKTDEVMIPALKILSEQKTYDRVCIASFSDRRLAYTRQHYPKFCTSMGPSEIFKIKLMSLGLNVFNIEGDCVQVPIYKYGVKLVTKHFINFIHERGLKIHVWTINDSNVMDNLIELGVDGIITDKPSELNNLIS